jgi:hypothetical protein
VSGAAMSTITTSPEIFDGATFVIDEGEIFGVAR